MRMSVIRRNVFLTDSTQSHRRDSTSKKMKRSNMWLSDGVRVTLDGSFPRIITETREEGCVTRLTDEPRIDGSMDLPAS